MNEIDNALKQAIDSLSLDNINLTPEQIEIIKSRLDTMDNKEEILDELIKISEGRKK